MRYIELSNGLVKVSLRDPKVPIKQHFFSAFHLSRFANDCSQLRVFTKTREPYWAKVKDCAQERYFHEYALGKDQTNGRIEAAFAASEALAAPVLNELLSKDALSVDSVMKWSLYLGGLFYRSNKFRTQIVEPLARKTFGELLTHTDRIREIQREYWFQGELITFAQVYAALERQGRLFLSQPAYLHFHGMDSTIPKLAFQIAQKTWLILNAPTDSPFITTDAPVATAQVHKNGALMPGYGFGREMTAIFVPLSPTRLLVASPPQVSWKRDLNSAEVQSFNMLLAQFGEKYLYASEDREPYRELAREHLDTVKFGAGAFRLPTGSS